MNDNLAADHAWSQCKGELEPHTWTVGESATYYGFFLNGWHARSAWDGHKASECQRLADEKERLRAENESLRVLLLRANDELHEMTQLDCPSSVERDEDLLRDICAALSPNAENQRA